MWFHRYVLHISSTHMARPLGIGGGDVSLDIIRASIDYCRRMYVQINQKYWSDGDRGLAINGACHNMTLCIHLYSRFLAFRHFMTLLFSPDKRAYGPRVILHAHGSFSSRPWLTMAASPSECGLNFVMSWWRLFRTFALAVDMIFTTHVVYAISGIRDISKHIISYLSTAWAYAHIWLMFGVLASRRLYFTLNQALGRLRKIVR